MTTHCHYCGIHTDRIKQLEAQLEYWKKDSAEAWDKCEERRLENERFVRKAVSRAEQLETQLASAHAALKEQNAAILTQANAIQAMQAQLETPRE